MRSFAHSGVYWGYQTLVGDMAYELCTNCLSPKCAHFTDTLLCINPYIKDFSDANIALEYDTMAAVDRLFFKFYQDEVDRKGHEI